MKILILKIIIPFTLISFTAFTKWWYALPVDAPETMFTGFPLPYTCPGWHTSLSTQIFMTELIIDILTYFLFWLLIFIFVDRYLVKIKTNKILTIGLWTITGFILTSEILEVIYFDNLYYPQRPFEINIIETGFKFIWQKTK